MGLFANLSFRKRSQLPELAGPAEPVTEAVAAPAAEMLPAMGMATPVPTLASAVDQSRAQELVHRVAQELPTFIAIAVVEAGTGKILAGQWAGHSGGATEVALTNAEIVRQTNLAIEALHLAATEQLTDILITLRHQLHLLRVLPQPAWLLYLAVHTQDTNAALARAVIQLIDN